MYAGSTIVDVEQEWNVLISGQGVAKQILCWVRTGRYRIYIYSLALNI